MTTTQTYLFLLAGLAVLFYFLILRPQRRVKAQREQLLASLRPGADIITAGGIHGTLVSVAEDELELEVADGVVLRLDPRAVAEVRQDDDEDDDDFDGEDDDDFDGEDDDDFDGENDDDFDGEDDDEDLEDDDGPGDAGSDEERPH